MRQAEEKNRSSAEARSPRSLRSGARTVTRTRMCVWGQCCRREERADQDQGIFHPVGRVPGRRKAVTSAWEVPAKWRAAANNSS